MLHMRGALWALACAVAVHAAPQPGDVATLCGCAGAQMVPGVRQVMWKGALTETLYDVAPLAPGSTLRQSTEGRVENIVPAVNQPAVGAAWSGVPATYIHKFADVHTGLLQVPAGGAYTFRLAADDGAKATLGGEVVVDNDGMHAMTELAGAAVTLSPGVYLLEVLHHQKWGYSGVVLSWDRPGGVSEVVPAGSLGHCSCPSGTDAPPTPEPTASPPTPVPTVAPETGVPTAQPTGVPQTAVPPTPAPDTPLPTAAPSTGAPSTWTPLGGDMDARFAALEATVQGLKVEVAELRTQLQATKGEKGDPGKHGYCAVTPNVTSVYIPVVRYTQRVWMRPDTCVSGPQSSRGPPSSPGVPSLVVTPSITDTGCTWGPNQIKEPMYAYAGDTLVFWRPASDLRHNVYLLKDAQAFAGCDFTGSTLVAGLDDLAAREAGGANFTYVLEQPGVYFFVSDTPGKIGEDRKEYCWHTQADGTYPGRSSNWGHGMKLEVRVLEPGAEVLADCPLFNPSDFGVSGSGVDGKSVARLKGAVGAITRQLISQETRLQERVRTEGNSGVTVTRSWGQGSAAYHQESFVGSGPGNAHNHADFKYTIGMGEFGAVLNGVQFNTRHNDYSLAQPDTTKTVAEYTATFPPTSTDIEFPPVPPSVTGTVDEQIAEMREYFRAFQEQNTSIRADYDKYFKPNLCYLEGAWTEAQEGVSEPFASDRHHIDADTWDDLNDKTAFLFNNGRKSQAENLPYLPSAFRALHEADGEVFEPRVGQWFYRIACVPVDQRVATKRFRVSSNLHQQVRQSKPATKEQLAQTTFALFEMDPTPQDQYSDTGAWPNAQTHHEFLDELMEQVPGFDGPRGNLQDESFGPLSGTHNGSGPLNTARYSRYYGLFTNDAMGRRQQKRAFNDMMFAAQTTHSRISPLTACIDYTYSEFATQQDQDRVAVCASSTDKFACFARPEWTSDEMSANASGAKCVWTDNSCKYKKCWTQRWSYAIPLEMTYTTPLTNWNPYNIDFHAAGTPGEANVNANGATGARPDTAYNGSNRRMYFRTPAAFFKDRADIDPADTSGGVTYVKDQNGVARAVRASGHWLLFPEIEGVGRVRQRYPIMPVHEHGSTTWKEAKAVQELVVGKDTVPEIRNIIGETRAEAYGQELLLTSGGGHEHRVSISPHNLHSLKNNLQPMLRVLSTTDSSHAHYIEITYDGTRGVGNEFAMTWCTFADANMEPCPASVDAIAGKCGTTPLGRPCCYGKCPDGHPGFGVFV